MIKIVLRILGLLLVLGGLYAVWLGIGANDEIPGMENDIQTQRSLLSGHRISKEKADEAIGNFEHDIEKKKMERNLWIGGGVVGLIVGFGLILMPSSRKRKTPAAAPVPESAPAPTPAQNQDAPGP